MIPETPLAGLLTALGIGLLIGLERGWKDRADPDGSRVAGFRTIGLIGFLGGLFAFIDTGSGLVIAAGFVGLTLLLREGFEAQIDVTRIVSVTTMVAALSAYALGALAVLGHSQAAAAGAVIVAFVLWMRTPLHALLHRIEEKELSALLRLLLISVVVLPVLPDQSYGPYDVFNPRAIWWMVVLISGLGFVGYLGVKWLGHRRGIGLLAIAGSFASSTAVTLSFARFSRNDAGDARALVGGTALAWAGMIVRTAFILGALAPSLIAPLALPFGFMLVVALVTAATFLLRRGTQAAPDLVLSNPLRHQVRFILRGPPGDGTPLVPRCRRHAGADRDLRRGPGRRRRRCRCHQPLHDPDERKRAERRNRRHCRRTAGDRQYAAGRA